MRRRVGYMRIGVTMAIRRMVGDTILTLLWARLLHLFWGGNIITWIYFEKVRMVEALSASETFVRIISK
jgi:hypothetical protein